jgi:hypothetical protein
MNYFFKTFLLNPIFFKSYILLSSFFVSFHCFAQEGKKFELSQQFYLQGNSILIGNNILGHHKEKLLNDHNVVNDLVDMVYINIDRDQSTFSSSSATVSQSISGEKVKYAALYWSAIYKYDKGKKRVRRNREIYVGNDSRSDDVNKIKFKPLEKEYIDIKGEIIFDSYHSNYFEETKPYVCYADVTAYLKNLSSINGSFSVANIKATEGYISGGSAAGWLLYIIYEDENETPKYFTTYNGLMEVANAKPVDILFNDFLPIESDEINTSLLVGALEGDYRFRSDMVSIKNVSLNQYVSLSNSKRPSNNFFNSSISIYEDFFTNRSPSSLNTLGFDLLKINIPNPKASIFLDKTAQIQFRFSTRSDRFYLFFTAFESEISDTFFAQKTESKLLPILAETKPTDFEEILEIPVSEDAIIYDKKIQKILEKLNNQAPFYISDLGQGYYLITNVFSRKRNTKNWKKHLIQEGFEPKSFINPLNNWEYVYIDYDETPQRLIDRVNKLSLLQDFEKIWILKNKKIDD